MDFLSGSITIIQKKIPMLVDCTDLACEACMLNLYLYDHGKIRAFIYLFLNFYWGIVDLQCCVSFRYTAK